MNFGNNNYHELTFREDAFPRYVRSEAFQKFSVEQGDTFVQSILADLSATGKHQLVFRQSDFEQTSVTDKDIAFVLRMNEDSTDWEPLRRTKYDVSVN